MEKHNRVEGSVLRYDDTRMFGIIEGPNGATYIAHESQIQPDGIFRRFLIPGERVSFQPVIKDRKGTFRAYNVRLLERAPIQVSSDYHELVTVRHWNGEDGNATRPLGGSLRFFSDAIITEGIETLKVGSQLWVVPAPMRGSRGNREWMATQIAICCETPESAPEQASEIISETAMASAFKAAESVQ